MLFNLWLVIVINSGHCFYHWKAQISYSLACTCSDLGSLLLCGFMSESGKQVEVCLPQRCSCDGASEGGSSTTVTQKAYACVHSHCEKSPWGQSEAFLMTSRLLACVHTSYQLKVQQPGRGEGNKPSASLAVWSLTWVLKSPVKPFQKKTPGRTYFFLLQKVLVGKIWTVSLVTLMF